MHQRFIIKFKSYIDMMTLLPTIRAFCQFVMVKCYQGWWSYDGDYTEMMMMMMMMMMASRTMIMLRRCFAATLTYLGRRLLQRKWGNGGGVRPNHSYSCHLLVFGDIWALSPSLSPSSSPKPSFSPTYILRFVTYIDSDLFSARKTINGYGHLDFGQ